MAAERNNRTREVKPHRRPMAKASAVAAIASIALLISTGCYAADGKDGFSLGYGTLQPVQNGATGKNPGVLTARYGFSLLKDFTPYIGTGVAYILPPESAVFDSSTKLKTGLAGQAGVSFNLGVNSTLSIDYKYLHFTNDPPTIGDKGTPPQSLGIGVHIKF